MQSNNEEIQNIRIVIIEDDETIRTGMNICWETSRASRFAGLMIPMKQAAFVFEIEPISFCWMFNCPGKEGVDVIPP